MTQHTAIIAAANYVLNPIPVAGFARCPVAENPENNVLHALRPCSVLARPRRNTPALCIMFTTPFRPQHGQQRTIRVLAVPCIETGNVTKLLPALSGDHGLRAIRPLTPAYPCPTHEDHGFARTLLPHRSCRVTKYVYIRLHTHTYTPNI